MSKIARVLTAMAMFGIVTTSALPADGYQGTERYQETERYQVAERYQETEGHHGTESVLATDGYRDAAARPDYATIHAA